MAEVPPSPGGTPWKVARAPRDRKTGDTIPAILFQNSVIRPHKLASGGEARNSDA